MLAFIMRCCCSKPEDEIINHPDIEERQPLLDNSLVNDVGLSVNNSDTTDSIGPTMSVVNSEQSALVSILHQTANELIDVSALVGISFEHQEQQTKAKQYSSRLQQTACNLSSMPTSPFLLTSTGVAAPAAVLLAPTVPLDDIQQITTAAERVATAVRSMKAIDKGQLVVPLTTFT